jgi:hypothetical protein
VCKIKKLKKWRRPIGLWSHKEIEREVYAMADKGDDTMIGAGKNVREPNFASA